MRPWAWVACVVLVALGLGAAVAMVGARARAAASGTDGTVYVYNVPSTPTTDSAQPRAVALLGGPSSRTVPRSSTSSSGRFNATKGETKLYRAVSKAEADDVRTTGAFGASPSGSEVKYFYGSRQDAVRFARAMRDKGYDYDRITSGVFGEDLIRSLGRPMLGGVERGEAFTVSNEFLPQIGRARVLRRRP